jgi:hypothetical protein
MWSFSFTSVALAVQQLTALDRACSLLDLHWPRSSARSDIFSFWLNCICISHLYQHHFTETPDYVPCVNRQGQFLNDPFPFEFDSQWSVPPHALNDSAFPFFYILFSLPFLGTASDGGLLYTAGITSITSRAWEAHLIALRGIASCILHRLYVITSLKRSLRA